MFAGLTTEGLYRVSGNKTDQDNIQKQFDQGKTHLHRHAVTAGPHKCVFSYPETLHMCDGTFKAHGAGASHYFTDRDPELFSHECLKS